MADLPDPPYPASVRAKGWRFELDYEKIEQSGTWSAATALAMEGLPLARPFLLAMWYAAWKQVPCGSLPADDMDLAGAIGIPRAVFAEYREVLLRGWTKARDGRLYHPTLTERVFEMMDKRRSDADRKARSRAAPAADPSESRDIKSESRKSPEGVTRDSDGSPPAVTRESSTDHLPPNTNTSSPSSKRKARERAPSADSGPAWSPPDWVPAQGWAQFVEHRKAMRGVPFTDAARDGVLRELAKLRDAGHDPGELLTTAIVRGWRTVFPPKPGGRFPINRQEAQEQRNRAVGDEWLRQQEASDATN